MTRDRKINIVAGIITLTVIMLVFVFTFRANAQDAVAKLTELEDSRYVSSYKTVLLTEQDVQQALNRRDKAIQQFNQLAQQLRDAHKWPAQTRIEIDTRADEWHSVVTLPEMKSNVPPPAAPVPAADSKKQNEKEKH